MKKIKLTPLADRVLVKPYTEEDLRKAGSKDKKKINFILPESMTKEKSARGKVLAVGEGRYVEGKLIPVKVKVGDIILFSKYSYDEVELDGEELYLLKEENILAKLF